MEFPRSYFEDEVRDGFYVHSLMKRAWAAQLEVLEDIDKVCKKHNIEYFAEWGTLLGAIRHGGFVPWDDDMDICMKREDYNKFLKVAPEEMKEYYHFLNFENSDSFLILRSLQLGIRYKFLRPIAFRDFSETSVSAYTPYIFFILLKRRGSSCKKSASQAPNTTQWTRHLNILLSTANIGMKTLRPLYARRTTAWSHFTAILIVLNIKPSMCFFH